MAGATLVDLALSGDYDFTQGEDIDDCMLPVQGEEQFRKELQESSGMVFKAPSLDALLEQPPGEPEQQGPQHEQPPPSTPDNAVGNGCVELHSPAGKRQRDQASDVVGLVHDVVAVKRRRIRLKRSRRPEDAPEPPKPSPKTPKEMLEGVDVALQRQLWNRRRGQWVCR
jgi:hypothetical protein